jgi:high affinity Mn2+ porin
MRFYTLLCTLLWSGFLSSAQDTVQQRANLHFQSTYIYQYKPAFSAAYSGENSLKTGEEKQNSITATIFLGVRLWKGAEAYVNPEVAGGSGLSGAYGLAASTNGETFRVGDPAPTLYLARGFIRQTITLGRKRDTIGDQANQLVTFEPKRYLRFYLGKMSLGDLFDINAYSNSPRTQAMNWCLTNNGAWDYAANLRGYTYSFVTMLQYDNWTYKAAIAALPKVANGTELQTDLSKEYALNAEVDKAYNIRREKGNARLLVYYNDGDMGNYKQALEHPDSAGLPDVIATRKYGRTKVGICFNADQQLSKSLGAFLRLGWSDGQNETWCFTEADQIASAGLSLSGDKWHRKDDNLSIGIDVNGLSANHRNYLNAGGLGFQLGDGRLTYANESALELYYLYKPIASNNIWLTGDYQFVLNPGYNADRGPVHVFAFRVHVEL